MSFFHSIRWRLQIWHGALLCLVLAGFGVTAHQLQRGNELRRVDQELQPRLRALMEAGRRPPGGDRRGGPPVFGPGEPPPPRGFRAGSVRGELFEGSQYLLAWCDSMVELKTICHTGRKATMVVRVDDAGHALTEGAQVEIGGNERYVSVSRAEFKRIFHEAGRIEPQQVSFVFE